VSGDDRWILFLASEAAAGFHLDDPNALSGDAEERGKGGVNVVRTLHRSPHRHAVGTGRCQHAVRLDVQLLLGASLVLAVDDDRSRGERRLDVAAADLVALEDVVLSPDDRPRLERLIDREHCRLGLDVDDDVTACLFERLAIVMREQHDWFLGMIDAIVRQVRLVIENQRNPIAAGNIARGDDREIGSRARGPEIDPLDVPARHRAAHGRAIQHAGKREIVDVPRLPGNLRAALEAGQRELGH
jgi:hypothetical protein